LHQSAFLFGFFAVLYIARNAVLIFHIMASNTIYSFIPYALSKVVIREHTNLAMSTTFLYHMYV
jgi:hypothetical protein